jgi:hypothetical protein
MEQLLIPDRYGRVHPWIWLDCETRGFLNYKIKDLAHEKIVEKGTSILMRLWRPGDALLARAREFAAGFRHPSEQKKIPTSRRDFIAPLRNIEPSQRYYAVEKIPIRAALGAQ